VSILYEVWACSARFVSMKILNYFRVYVCDRLSSVSCAGVQNTACACLLQHTATVCCSALQQCVAVCCSKCWYTRYSMCVRVSGLRRLVLQCVYCVLRCLYRVLQCVYHVLQCVAVCCSACIVRCSVCILCCSAYLMLQCLYFVTKKYIRIHTRYRVRESARKYVLIFTCVCVAFSQSLSLCPSMCVCK